MEKVEVLRQYFGFSSFREGQQTLIDAVLAGRDVLGVMPTGGGKSLCYELPALLLPGLTLVISPLISLMKDQVMALQNAGIPAGCIHSAMSVEELREAYRDELTFLAISHLLIAASVRVARIDCKSELLGQFRDYMEKNFPDFRENRYLPRLDRNKRLVYRLLLKRRYRVVRLLFRIKDGR